MTWYLRVKWEHDYDVEPVEILSEVGEDGYEARKIEYYRDGRSDWADSTRETDTIFLGETPVPPPSEINEQDEFAAAEITAEEFEDAWARARG